MFEVIYSKFSNDRDDKFKIKTLIGLDEHGQKKVKKIALTEKAKNHIKNMADKIDLLKKTFSETKFKVNFYDKVYDGQIVFPYIEGQNLTSIINDYIKSNKMQKAYELICDFYNELKKIAKNKFVITPEFKNIFGNVEFQEQLYSLDVTDIDMIFDNIIISDSNWNVIDTEWTFDFPISVEYVIYRAISVHDFFSLKEQNLNVYEIFKLLNINTDTIERFELMDQNFSKYVLVESVPFRDTGREIFKKQFNLNYMFDEKENANIYLNYGDGYSEDKKIQKEYTILKSRANIDLFIEIPDGVKSIRFDPIENRGLILRDLNITSNDGKRLNFKILNGLEIQDYIIFKDEDPQIEIDFKHTPTLIKIKTECIFFDLKTSHDIYNSLEKLIQENQSKSLEIENRVSKILDLGNELKAAKNENLYLGNELKAAKNENLYLGNELKAAKNENLYLGNELKAVLNSTIWKLTKSVRVAVNIVKGVPRKLKKIFFRLFVKKLFLCEQGLIKNIDDVEFCLEKSTYKQNILVLEGWIFGQKFEINNINFLVCSKNFTHRFKPEVQIERMDVYEVYKEKNSKNCGFKLEVEIGNFYELEIYLDFNYANSNEKLKLGYLQNNFFNNLLLLGGKINLVNIKKAFKYISTLNFVALRNKLSQSYTNEKTDPLTDILTLISDFDKKNEFDCKEMYDEIIDIIIPIYNGFDYLEKFLPTIELTNLSYNIIFIEDKSTDGRVLPYIKKYAINKKNILIIENETNLGFVKSVNKGLSVSKNHKVLLNTDVELPPFWLERLVYPLFVDKKIASATPYTNSGTICSFPNIKLDNKLFCNLSLKDIDDSFGKIKPKYTELPTGVGFCFAMSKYAISSVGLLDEKNFGQGYGEENDWCQRAKKCGFKNVQVENLFVYHKHGASFSSEQKKELINKNSKTLLKKHPNYEIEVSNFFKLDPNKPIRDFLIFLLSCKATRSENILVFDHNIGGGATKYLDKYQKDMVEAGWNFIIVRYDQNKNIYLIQQYFQEFSNIFKLAHINDIKKIFPFVNPSKIIVNELVTYPNFYEMLELILDIKSKYKSKLVVPIHDYYFVCPSYNLLDDKGQFCYLPSLEKCENCMKHNEYCSYKNYSSISLWQKKCKELLLNSDEITVFSNDSKELIEKVYGQLPNISLKPHTVDYVKKIPNIVKTTSTINIGLLGILCYKKGLCIVKDMLDIIEKENLNIKIILIGSSEGNLKHKNYLETGKYTRNMLSDLVLKNEIDIFFIASIWPETFSYTTQEIIEMNMPVACFDLGAPAERIKNYHKGLIIKNISAKDVLNSILYYQKN